MAKFEIGISLPPSKISKATRVRFMIGLPLRSVTVTSTLTTLTSTCAVSGGSGPKFCAEMDGTTRSTNDTTAVTNLRINPPLKFSGGLYVHAWRSGELFRRRNSFVQGRLQRDIAVLFRRIFVALVAQHRK